MSNTFPEIITVCPECSWIKFPATLRRIHTEQKRKQKRKFAMMFKIFSLISLACSLIFFAFTFAFSKCEQALTLFHCLLSSPGGAWIMRRWAGARRSRSRVRTQWWRWRCRRWSWLSWCAPSCASTAGWARSDPPSRWASCRPSLYPSPRSPLPGKQNTVYWTLTSLHRLEFFFINFFVDTCLLMGQLIHLFWTSGDFCCRIQSHSGHPYSHLAEVYMMYCTFPEINLRCNTCWPPDDIFTVLY